MKTLYCATLRTEAPPVTLTFTDRTLTLTSVLAHEDGTLAEVQACGDMGAVFEHMDYHRDEDGNAWAELHIGTALKGWKQMHFNAFIVPTALLDGVREGLKHEAMLSADEAMKDRMLAQCD